MNEGGEGKGDYCVFIKEGPSWNWNLSYHKDEMLREETSREKGEGSRREERERKWENNKTRI